MKTKLKNLFLRIIDFLGLPHLSLFLLRNRPLILLYHGVYPATPETNLFNYRKKFLTPRSFENQIRWLKARFRIVPLSYIIERLKTRQSFPKYCCAITFDDGYENFYKFAFPILKKHGVPATVFVTTDFIDHKAPLWVDALEFAIGTTNTKKLELNLGREVKLLKTNSIEEKRKTDSFLRSYLKKISNQTRKDILESIIKTTGKDLGKEFIYSPYRPMKWGQIQYLSESKITIAPHTKTHPILSRLAFEEAREEITESRNQVKKILGKSPQVFAYPNGEPQDFTEDTISILKESGFVAAFTTVPGRISKLDDPYRLKRVSMDGTDEMYFFRVTVSGPRHTLSSIFKLIK